jgi:proteasome lid subunit RPN8/RPN11
MPVPQKIYEPERFQSPEYLAVISNTPASLTSEFAPEAWQTMQHICQTGYPNEVCGLLLGSNNHAHCYIHEVRQVQNINTERASDRFQLDPDGYQAIDREIRKSDLDIIGVFHSHPDCPAKPSPTDLDSAWEGFLYPIISVCDGTIADVRCWEPNDDSKCFHPVHLVESRP